MLLFTGVLISVLVPILLTVSAMLLTERVPMYAIALSDATKKNPIDADGRDHRLSTFDSKIRGSGSLIEKHWTGFNVLSGVVSMSSGLLVLFLSPYTKPLLTNSSDPDIMVAFLAVESACMLGFHLIWSSALDWRYHLIPRYGLVLHMLLQVVLSVICLAVSPNFRWLVLSIVLSSIMCWLMGVLPGSGMSDGRLFVILAASTIPFMLTTVWIPTVIGGVIAIVNAASVFFINGGSGHAESNTKLNMATRLLTSKSPMGPCVMTPFWVCFMLAVTGVINTTMLTLL